MAPEPLPHLPLLRLHCSRNDLLRRLLERQPAWGHIGPGQSEVHGERGVTRYRLTAESFFLQVDWRWTGASWEERDVTIVPGAVVALRIVLGEVDPETVTRCLDLPPTRAFGKGEIGPRGGELRDEGLWIHEVLQRGFHWPEDKVAELLALLRACPGYRDVLAHPGVRSVAVTVHLRGCLEQMGSFSLDPRLLEDLVGLSLQLDLEMAAD
ncbi:MAG TPA: hypothetical protein VFD82_17800 [Planctomycetota bacterium]|nr:hypothetical protein [Planctomycetota bacterium]